jgi:hypothetical protein
MNPTAPDDDEPGERDDPRALAALIRGRHDDELDTLDPDSDDPRMLARVISAARGYRTR